MKTRLFGLFCLLLIAYALGGCSAPIKNVQPEKRFFWPPEPDEPRVEWIASYFGESDIKEQGYMSSIVGDDSTILFRRPISVAGDGEGHFVVSDQELGQAFMFDLNKRQALLLGNSESTGSFSQPSGVAVDADNNFYVADTKTRKVTVVTNENLMLRVLDLSKHAKSIGSLVVDRPRARLVVPDGIGKKVLIFSLKGDLISTIDGKGNFSFPNAVAVESNGTIIIADSYNATIVRFSLDGKFINAIGKRGDAAGNLSLATGVAVDSEDHIYVTDGRLNNVTIFDQAGNPLMVIGGAHSVRTGNIGRGGFLSPQAISIDKKDRIYIADSFNQRVQIMQFLNERYLKEHPIAPVKP